MGNVISLRKEGFTPGKTYEFNPPVSATGFPVGGRNAATAQILSFKKGWCIAFKEEQNAYLFQGSPVDDPREIENTLRECYFFVEQSGGSFATIID